MIIQVMTYFSVELVSEVDHFHFVVVLLFRRNNKPRAKRLEVDAIEEIDEEAEGGSRKRRFLVHKDCYVELDRLDPKEYVRIGKFCL